MPTSPSKLPLVAYWRVIALRLVYLLIILGLSSFVWQQLLFEAADLATMTGVAKSMMAALVILCVFGLRYPLDLLPVLVFELLWKALWMLLIALPAALYDRWTEPEPVFRVHWRRNPAGADPMEVCLGPLVCPRLGTMAPRARECEIGLSTRRKMTRGVSGRSAAMCRGETA